MSKEERRNYLKPFRCVGGFMFAISIFVLMFSVLSIGLMIFTTFVFGESGIANNINELITYGLIIYTYYLGYRIFFKKYDIKLLDFKKIEKNKIFKCILSMIVAFILVRFSWIIWDFVLDLIGYAPNVEGTEVYLIGIIYVTILAPIIEEIVFRGWILKTLQRYGNVVAVVISSICFGIFHGTLTQAIPAIFIGVILALLTLKYNSIIPSVIVHLVSNSLSIILELLGNVSMIGVITKYCSLVIIILSIIFIIYYLIRNVSKVFSKLDEFKESFKLQVTSLSYIFFIIYCVVTIVYDLMNGI